MGGEVPRARHTRRPGSRPGCRAADVHQPGRARGPRQPRPPHRFRPRPPVRPRRCGARRRRRRRSLPSTRGSRTVRSRCWTVTAPRTASTASSSTARRPRWWSWWSGRCASPVSVPPSSTGTARTPIRSSSSRLRPPRQVAGAAGASGGPRAAPLPRLPEDHPVVKQVAKAKWQLTQRGFGPAVASTARRRGASGSACSWRSCRGTPSMSGPGPA